MNSDGSGQTQLTFERTKVIELAKKKQKEENTKRKQALEKALQEERTGAAIPQDESSAQPLGKGPLSGRWQASADDQFQIEDDGTTVEIKLIRSDNLQTFSGKLTRDANEPDTKPLKGDLDAIFKLDATKEYKISVTAMIVDANHLRLNCSGCPVWKNGRKLPGSRDSKVVWTRSSNTPGKKTGD
jgi:hypothetical protein